MLTEQVLSSARSELDAWTRRYEQFRSEQSPWCRLVNDWFYGGIEFDSEPVEGIDKVAAVRHCKAILGSFEPKHEHKIAGVAYLLSQWFKEPKWSRVKKGKGK